MEIVPNISNKVLFNNLLEDAKGLGEVELKAFIRELIRLLPREHEPEKDREQDLIDKIKNGGLPEAFWVEYNDLADQSDEKQLSETERERFQELINRSRVWDLERIKLMLELSEIWGISLDETKNLLSSTPESTNA